MRRLLACGLLLGWAGVALAGEAVLEVVTQSMKGKATMVNKLLPDGSKYVRLGLILKNEKGESVSVLQESTYDKRGRPVRHLQVTNLQSNNTRQSVVVTFDKEGAKVKIDNAGKIANEAVPYPEGKRIEATPEFWLIRDKVSPGGASTYWRFDLNQLKWVETTTTYRGKRTITIGGKPIEAHLVTFGESRAYLDDSGDPWKIESAGGSMTREVK